MFIPGTVQALIAALTFGIVIQAATPSVFPLLKGHGSNIFRDGLRLVLITFLISSALWAQIDFIGLTLDPTSTSGCQVVVIFNSVFDQLARFAIEQFLLWTTNANASTPAGAVAYQAVLGVRFVLGGVFVGFQKAQIATVCVARNDLLVIGAVVMATDFVIIAMLAFRASSIGIKSVQSKTAIMWTIVGLAFWTATSVPLLLGIDTIEMFFRTALPATGLSILLTILTSSFGALLPARQKQAVHPDAQSPRNISSSRDLSTSDTDYPPSRYEDLKAGAMATVTTFNQPRDFMAGAGGALPIIAGSIPGQANIGVGGLPVQGQLFPPTRSQTAPVRESRRIDVKPNLLNKRSIFDRAGPTSNIRNAISNPILQETGEKNPLSKIATIDLATAAKNDREKRSNVLTMNRNSSTFNAHRPAPQPPAITPDEALRRAQSGKRKEVGLASTSAEPAQARSAGLMSNPPATTSSAQLSPGVEEIRRRSPRQLPDDYEQNREVRSATPPQPIPMSSNSPPRPPRAEQPLSSVETVARSASQRTVETSLSQSTLDRSASQKSTASSVQTTTPPMGLVPPPKSAARLMSPKKPDLPSTWPIQTVVDPTIRPSRQKPPSPKSPVAPLQRRPTGGLPSNPRAMTMKPVAKEPSAPQEQTVMFVNNIQYNDPTAVQNIIQGATNQAAKTPLLLPSPAPPLKSSNSVVHRPRPIPRQQGKDRPIFPAENSPNHKRSKSGGSIVSRKSILMSNPGSPTQLPPLPPPPKSAGGQPVRALPNDTKSMTFDEKMDLFFPVALGRSTDTNGQTRTSIPEMPLVPSSYMLKGDHATEEKGAQSKRSDRSTKTSVRTRSVLEIEEEEGALPDVPARFTSKFSVDTSVVSGRPDEHESWIPALPNDRAKSSYDGAKRRSSPVIPVGNASPSEFSEIRTAKTRDEETTTNWGSIHSPVAAVNILDVTHMPKPTWIQPRDERNPRDLSMISQNDGKEVMTIMLDASMEHDMDLSEAPPKRQSPARLPDEGVADQHARWHRRIGDERITFTERKEKVQSRRQPPPMPLQLRSPAKKMAIVMHAAEPSPLESPQHAYEMIQAQLKKLEEPSRDSYESQGQRIRLLESLEAEMGQQENQWHEMQHGLSRDSLSTVGTSSVRNSQNEPAMANSPAVPSIDVVPRVIPQRNDISLESQAARRARMAASKKSSDEDLRSASSISSQSQSNSSDNRTSLWQQRLADAQMEYMENASELLAKRNLNFLSVSKVPLSATALQLGSPTPPDTDESDPDDAQILARLRPNERATPPKGLWSPDSPVYFEREQPSLLWAPAHHSVATKSSVPSGDGHALPGLSVRPATRKVSEPLNISSSQLWQPDHTAAKKLRTTSGLWRASWVPEPPKPQPRPVTQRPPRRNKRVTLLPDILESPKPLPDKRGTLGIFQFPWGEKSDTATVQPRPSHMLMAMPGTMSTGGSAIRAALEARAQQLESEEYSSSFFDDYDEEEEGDDQVSDIERDNDSDDGFDETTLWEIASLLQTDQVPSKNSLLPQPVYYRPDSFVKEEEEEHSSPRSQSEYEDSEEETSIADEDTKHDSMVITIAAEAMPAALEQISLLWAPRPISFIAARKAVGLPQPDTRTWESYVEKLEAAPRARECVLEPAVIHSNALWTRPVKKMTSNTTGRMWNKPQQQTVRTLWAAQSAVALPCKAVGLPQPDTRTWESYVEKLEAAPRARERVPEPAVIYSTALWAPVAKKPTSNTTGLMWSKPQRQATRTLWAAQPAITHSRKAVGLPQPDARTWESYVEKLEAAPRARERVPEPAVIHSTALWAPVVKNTASRTTGPMWTKPQQRAARTLWAAQTTVVYTEPTGLFDASHKRACFRTTSAEPVGLSMSSGARVTSEELPQLMSTSLWAPTPVVTRVENWMSFSTARPGSPLGVASSGRSTPSLDTASTRSYDEEVASDFEPLPEVPVKKATWWDSFKSKVSPPAQARPKPEPLRRTKATPAEWEAALNEAIRSIPSPRLVRVEATPAQWASALNKAIADSFNAAKSHPAFAGSVQTTAICDPAVANPVFFSQSPAPASESPSLMPEELTKSTSASHAVPIWSAPVVKIPPRLHAHDTAPMKAEDPEARRLRVKRANTDVSASSPSELASFNSQMMWNRFYGAELRRVTPRGDGRNWLEGAVKPPVSKVIFRY
ncbi:hypothetical protein LX32DRAFT_714010 [Colletotrichum zoysiae]|uniref:Uncharacterized protein n=1 Tax=Colletotrichum zoysiae TaxID=1216348 RepID=A0AAD9HLQ1_9PEZI|nr:hypothetical protein LX32DRAFT_714010 [Colletotrichum zoysiae]